MSRSSVKMHPSYKLSSILLALFTIIAIAFLILVVMKGLDQSTFDLSFYKLKDQNIKENVRVINISDLHLSEFGKDNERLVDQIRRLHPDIITVTGDLTIYGNPDHRVAITLLKRLVEIAPVYYSYGNHEYAEVLFDEGSTLREDIKSTGVTLVNNSYETVEINGSVFSIGGFCAAPANFYDNAERFMDKFIQSPGYHILLCHYTECFETVMAPYSLDVAFTAHNHGGQIRLPIIGGLYTPDLGFFPDNLEGLKILGDAYVIINRGLGNSHKLPRFNNNPEIVILDINWH